MPRFKHYMPWCSHAALFSHMLVAIVLCLLPLTTSAQSQRLDSLCKKEKFGGTTDHINILRKFSWQATLSFKGGRVKQFLTTDPDTIECKGADSLLLTTQFTVNPQLTGQTVALVYSLSGAVSINANGAEILNTGVFNTSKDKKLCDIEVEGFANLPLRDTTQKLTVRYIPDRRINLVNLRLKLEELSLAQKNKENKLVDQHGDYALGFYFMAFGIVFLFFFLFTREKTEYMYFALFCLCAGFCNLCDSYSSYLSAILFLFLFVFSLEFMSFFLAKVLRNKNKSRITLLVKILITLACFHPWLLYNFSFMEGFTSGNINNMPVPLFLIIIFGLLFCISAFSCIYYLFSGFKQKRWEARTIVYVCCLALFISFIVPFIAAFVPVLRHSVFIDNLSSVGIYLYPLSAVIVLGRTNRLNQKKLIDQVKSIEMLSQQNLDKEKEKQQLLESQNSELENKVTARTIDIIRQKEELETKNREIEIKNKAITDNINYAQRIQSAILPDIKLIYKALEQSFILFLPKDIVSGDFYAFAERNGRVVIIAGDCTGHGVSGAFMSMIGSSLLNQIINERGIEEPALILNQLNSAVIEALKQGENESNDGMDISICSFDLVKKELQYSGANRPLWLVRNSELQVFRPDKFPIGGLQMARNRRFTNYTVQLQQNDTIYIFTDGFADQFGGINGKKLMTAKFKELLIAIQYMDMRAQEHYLKAHFEQWKGGNEQVDDVLVIGVRV